MFITHRRSASARSRLTSGRRCPVMLALLLIRATRPHPGLCNTVSVRSTPCKFTDVSAKGEERICPRMIRPRPRTLQVTPVREMRRGIRDRRRLMPLPLPESAERTRRRIPRVRAVRVQETIRGSPDRDQSPLRRPESEDRTEYRCRSRRSGRAVRPERLQLDSLVAPVVEFILITLETKSQGSSK